MVVLALFLKAKLKEDSLLYPNSSTMNGILYEGNFLSVANLFIA